MSEDTLNTIIIILCICGFWFIVEVFCGITVLIFYMIDKRENKMINEKCYTCDNLDSNANGLYCQILAGGCNEMIISEYQKGYSLTKLSEKYFMSFEAVRKIIADSGKMQEQLHKKQIVN